ncbi:Hypothetical predicted protein [Marmota monax]|uniref:Uncharacterized protein n=2 Tax=Marmota monax TaxID=9995 RepID=A0A5E4CH95_MARMO|nr:hypothetical protein GHT09_005351 [Marmota monax]VTJ81188.1 Hypothetical predicted protein [Marmota monax]
MGCQGPARLRPSVPAGGSPSTPARGQGLLRHKTKMTTTLHDMVDQLEQILSVSELLEKHGLEKPISFVKNIQSSSEEARKLMVRLTRHAGRKQPPVSESHWRTLLQDMLTMQQNVYTCLDPDACYEVTTPVNCCLLIFYTVGDKEDDDKLHCDTVQIADN